MRAGEWIPGSSPRMTGRSRILHSLIPFVLRIKDSGSSLVPQVST